LKNEQLQLSVDRVEVSRIQFGIDDHHDIEIREREIVPEMRVVHEVGVGVTSFHKHVDVSEIIVEIQERIIGDLIYQSPVDVQGNDTERGPGSIDDIAEHLRHRVHFFFVHTVTVIVLLLGLPGILFKGKGGRHTVPHVLAGLCLCHPLLSFEWCPHVYRMSMEDMIKDVRPYRFNLSVIFLYVVLPIQVFGTVSLAVNASKSKGVKMCEIGVKECHRNVVSP